MKDPVDLEQLIKMMDRPLNEMADADVQRLIATRLGNCISELEQTRNREKRRHIIGKAMKCLFVLGRWSMLAAWTINTLDVWY